MSPMSQSSSSPASAMSPARTNRQRKKFCVCKAYFDEETQYGDISCDLCQQVRNRFLRFPAHSRSHFTAIPFCSHFILSACKTRPIRLIPAPNLPTHASPVSKNTLRRGLPASAIRPPNITRPGSAATFAKLGTTKSASKTR